MSKLTQKWVDLLLPFTSSYSAQFTESELSKKSKVPQQSASRYLQSLVLSNLLEYSKKGNMKLFYLPIKKQSTKITLNLIESHKSLKFRLTSKEISPLIDELMQHSESIIIFGSYASGTQDEKSDIDILILGKHNEKEIKKIKQREVVVINEHYATYHEFEKLIESRHPLAIEIAKNHVLFGDISRVINILWRKEYGKI